MGAAAGAGCILASQEWAAQKAPNKDRTAVKILPCGDVEPRGLRKDYQAHYRRGRALYVDCTSM